MPLWYTLYMSKGNKIKNTEGGMKIGETIRVGKGEFVVEDFTALDHGCFDVVMTAYHRPGVKFYGKIRRA